MGGCVWVGGPCMQAHIHMVILSPLGGWVIRCVGGEVATYHKSSHSIEISWLVQDFFHF